jgi:ParB family chromosome partitioning protein
LDVAQRAASEGLSVRQVERLVKHITELREEQPGAVRQDPNVRAAAQRLGELLGTRVRIVEKSENRGRIEIEYYSADELSRLYDVIAAAAGG